MSLKTKRIITLSFVAVDLLLVAGICFYWKGYEVRMPIYEHICVSNEDITKQLAVILYNDKTETEYSENDFETAFDEEEDMWHVYLKNESNLNTEKKGIYINKKDATIQSCYIE